MDTSKEYIKMCEKAEEIQEGDYGNGDILVYRGNAGMFFEDSFYKEPLFCKGYEINYVNRTI